jgi:hypothetical protein
MAGRFNFPDNQKVRREEATQRAAAREQRGDAGQLKKLESRGFGECREAKRLREKLAKS